MSVGSTLGQPQAAAAPERVVGINDHPVWLRESRDVAFDLIEGSNVQALRIDVPWDVVEPAKGSYSTLRLGLLDDYVNRAAAAGIEVLMIPSDSPSWASGTSDRRAPPLRNSDYADFVEFLVDRYRGKVSAFEIWNEPNGGWAWTNPDPVRYASLLKAASTRAKSVDPSVTILAPSLSGPDQGAFLEAFYAQGTKDYFDVFSMHGYWWNVGSWPTPYYDSRNPDRSVFGQFTTRIMPILEKYGDEDKPVWWTETGIATSGGPTSAADQSRAVTEAFDAWEAGAIPTMERLYWYMIFDTVGSGSEANFGLVDLTGASATQPRPTDFEPKSAYTAFSRESADVASSINDEQRPDASVTNEPPAPSAPRGPSTQYVSLPWSSTVYAVLPDGTVESLSPAQWAAAGSPAPTTVSSVLGTRYVKNPASDTVYAVTPDGATHPMTWVEFVAAGMPAVETVTAPLGTDYVKASWSDSIYAIQPSGAVSWLTYAQWTSAGAPTPRVVPAVPGTRYTQPAGRPEIYATTPDGQTHHLSYPEWVAAGAPTPM